MSFIFSQEALDHCSEQYRTEARPMHGESARGGCMRAVYIGLGALFGDRYKFRGDFHREFFREARRKEKEKGVPEGRFNTIDRVFRALEDEGVAFAEQTFNHRTDHWELPDGTRVDNLEDALHDQLEGMLEGPHFFGAALDGAIHSILLRLDNTEGNRRTFWLDQFSEGFEDVRPGGFVSNPDITGELDQILHRSFAGNKTTIWELNPTAADGVFVPADTSGDGDPDASMPAVEARDA